MDFIPQENLSAGIINALIGANNFKTQQSNTAVAQQEANTAASRLTSEQPEIAARTALMTSQNQDLQNSLNLHRQILQGFDTSHPIGSGPISQAHVMDAAGAHALNIAQPSAPNSDGTVSSPSATPTGPTASPQPDNSGLDVYQRQAQAVGAQIGGFSKSEAQDAELAYEKFAAAPSETSVKQFHQDLAAIVKRRDDPDYAKQIQYEKQGMDAQSAKLAVVRDNKTSAALTSLESDPSKLSGANSVAAIAQLANLAKQPNQSDDTKQRIANLQDVAAAAHAQASKSEFEAYRDAYKAEHGQEPSAADVQAFKTAGQQLVIQGKGDLTSKDYFDTQNNSIVQMTPNDFVAAKKADPTRFVEYNTTVQKNLSAHSLINGIRDTVSQLNEQLADPQFDSKLDKGTASILGAAMRATDETAFSTLVGKLAIDQMSQPQQQYVNNLLQLHERAMSLRALQSAGAGSDQSREAIFRTLPALVDNKSNAQLKLGSLSNELDNVQAGFPSIGKSNVSARERKLASGGPTGGGAPKYQVGDTIQQNGHAYTVTSVDANGKVTGAN